jgi:pimeloyl-ACP methyl ester carboxylesterase
MSDRRTLVLKWIRRVGLGFLAVFALFSVVVAGRFLAWRGAIVNRLEANSSVIGTSTGPVEYADVGHGVPVLMIHGTPGGYDQALGIVKATGFSSSELRVIAPSRPGYLRTPLESGRTPEQQARLYAALLTKLGIDKVFVLGASGGGPSALQFAMLYPDRCSGLILEAAVTQKIVVGGKSLVPVVQDFLIFIFRARAIDALQAKDPTDPVLSKIGEALFDSFVPASSRVAGVSNDYRQFARIGNWPLSSIRCPTLILHGTLDKDVPIAQAEFAHAQIKNSEIVRLPGADHDMFFTKYKALNTLIAAFIVKHQ